MNYFQLIAGVSLVAYPALLVLNLAIRNKPPVTTCLECFVGSIFMTALVDSVAVGVVILFRMLLLGGWL